MNKPCMVIKCERCGSECQLMYKSVRNNTVICPVCMDNEIDCCLASPDIPGCYEIDDIMHNTYLYVTDCVSLYTN